MNNLRDYEADKNANKKTIVVAMGPQRAKLYHLFLVGGAILLAIIYTVINYNSPWQWLFFTAISGFVFLNLKTVFTYKNSIELYPELGKLAMGTLLFAISFGVGLIVESTVFMKARHTQINLQFKFPAGTSRGVLLHKPRRPRS